MYYNQEALLLLPLVGAIAAEFLCSPKKESRQICKMKPENTFYQNNYLSSICNLTKQKTFQMKHLKIKI